MRRVSENDRKFETRSISEPFARKSLLSRIAHLFYIIATFANFRDFFENAPQPFEKFSPSPFLICAILSVRHFDPALFCRAPICPALFWLGADLGALFCPRYFVRAILTQRLMPV